LSENTFNRVQAIYERSLRWSLQNRLAIFAVFLLSIVATIGAFMIMPQDFLPSSDQGQIFGLTEAPNGTSFDQMVRYQQQAAAVLAKDPNIEGFMSAVGSGGSSSGVNSGRVFASLKPLSQRSLSADQIIRKLQPKLDQIAGAQTYFGAVQDVRVGGRASNAQYQYTLHGEDANELYEWTPKVQAALTAVADRCPPRRSKGRSRPIWSSTVALRRASG